MTKRSVLMSKTFLEALTPAAYRAVKTTVRDGMPRIVAVDSSWYMPNVGKNGKNEFLNKERIKGSVFFDLDDICSKDSPYPHMLPTYETFNSSIGRLGIEKTDKLVVYDSQGIFSSPRVAWTLSLFGHPHVYLLNNYLAYKQCEYPVQTIPVNDITPYSPTQYVPISKDEFQQNYNKQVIEYEELLDLVKSGNLSNEYLVFDARSNDRFTGAAPEPRPGLSSGHIPGSFNLPFPKVLGENKAYKSKQELLELFKSEFNLDLSNPNFLDGRKGIIVLCGTGVTAVILKLAIELIIGANVPVRVYDGSWSEWAARAPEEYIAKTAS